MGQHQQHERHERHERHVPPETPAARASLHGLREARTLEILPTMSRRLRVRWLALALGLGLAGPVFGGCEGHAPPLGASEPWPQGLAKPADVAEASALRASGVVWTDRQVRQLYLERVAAIGERDAQQRAQGQGAEARARAAYQARHDARMTARAMMRDQEAVRGLEARDRLKYGDPDGPTFEYLVERGREKGREGDALFEGIVESAQRTDEATDRSFGL